jgi:hypothetical protein
MPLVPIPIAGIFSFEGPNILEPYAELSIVGISRIHIFKPAFIEV